MIVGKSAILKYFESIGEPYFAIFYKGQVEKGNAIFRNDKDSEKDYTGSESREAFERTLELLQYGDYTIVISDKKNVTTRGNNRVDFKIGLNEAAPATAQSTPVAVSGVSMEDVERKANEIAEKKFQQLMDKKALADAQTRVTELEKENRELERKVTEPWNKFINAAAPHSESIIAGIMGRPVATKHVPLSGVDPDVVSGPDPDSAQVIESFITALAEVKPTEWQNILVKLTTMIKEDPQHFETALKFL